ncbi:major facilitator superfamily domain-containing protein [Lipomyces kononenkoae]
MDEKNAVHHHGPVPALINPPAGPQDYDTINGEIVDNNEMPNPKFDAKDEKAIFSYLLHPDDSYDENGTYWADMSFGKKIAFITKVNNAETKREFGDFMAMFKKDPLSPIGWYMRNCVIPGAGLGLEGYVLFSIGNLTPLFQKVWPTCWKTAKVCNSTWLAATTYLEVCGIIVGQILVGLIGDSIGRRFGLIQDVVIMFVGLLMLTASWGTSLNGWVICYSWSLFFYSIGVGGEYPMTATAGMENAVGSGKISTKDDRLHRGRKVVQAFLMQGWGQFFNQVLLILLLLIFHHGSGLPPYSEVSAQWTYRVSFAIPALGTLWLVYYRYYKMPSASKQLALAKKKANVTGYDMESLKLTFTYFGPRMLGTTLTWFANDVLFYGNKLFQGKFISVISPTSTSVMEGWLYNLINVGVSLVGYYLASFLVDHKLYGRKWMMIIGFLMDFVLFVVPAFHYDFYIRPENITAFQAMYFLSSFFQQFGPNCVTFLAAAEVYPTSVRATAHGISAAAGKLGALVAAIVYNYISVQSVFYFVPWFGLLGMIVTFVFMPDTTGLDLKEQERRWQFIKAGNPQDYHGVAIHPTHLSLWERFTGVGKYYDPVADYEQRVNDMKRDWEEKQAKKFTEAEKFDMEEDDDTEYSEEMKSYLEKNSPLMKATQ